MSDYIAFPSQLLSIFNAGCSSKPIFEGEQRPALTAYELLLHDSVPDDGPIGTCLPIGTRLQDGQLVCKPSSTVPTAGSTLNGDAHEQNDASLAIYHLPTGLFDGDDDIWERILDRHSLSNSQTDVPSVITGLGFWQDTHQDVEDAEAIDESDLVSGSAESFDRVWPAEVPYELVPRAAWLNSERSLAGEEGETVHNSMLSPVARPFFMPAILSPEARPFSMPAIISPEPRSLRVPSVLSPLAESFDYPPSPSNEREVSLDTVAPNAEDSNDYLLPPLNSTFEPLTEEIDGLPLFYPLPFIFGANPIFAMSSLLPEADAYTPSLVSDAGSD